MVQTVNHVAPICCEMRFAVGKRKKDQLWKAVVLKLEKTNEAETEQSLSWNHNHPSKKGKY